MNHECKGHTLDLICITCAKNLMKKYEKLLNFIKQEIRQRDYVCTTNHAVLLDNAESLLKEIGEGEK